MAARESIESQDSDDLLRRLLILILANRHSKSHGIHTGPRHYGRYAAFVIRRLTAADQN